MSAAALGQEKEKESKSKGPRAAEGAGMVGESCYEVLLAELVRYARERGGAGRGAEGPTVLLETLGAQVGERLCERLTRDRPRFPSALEVLKFFSKELWPVVFRKQLDNLKTNHRGMFVLYENRFRWLARASAPRDFWDRSLPLAPPPASAGTPLPGLASSAPPPPAPSPLAVPQLAFTSPPSPAAPSTSATPGLPAAAAPAAGAPSASASALSAPAATPGSASPAATPGATSGSSAAPSPLPALPPLQVVVDQETVTAYTAIFSGIIRGALAAVGIQATVSVEASLPSCVFTVQTAPNL